MIRSRLVVLVALLCCGPAFAQYGAFQYPQSYSYSNPMSSYLNQMVWNRVNERALISSMLKKKGFTDAQLKAMSTDEQLNALGGPKKAVEEAKKLPALTATKFKPSSKRLLAPDLAKAMSTKPEEQKVMLQIFEAGLGAYAKETKKDGFDHDVAGALAFFLGAAMMVSHDGVAPDDDGLALVARQLQQTLESPEMKKTPDADKQRFFELMICMGSWLLAGWESAVSTNDDAFKAQLKESAAMVIKGYLKLEPSQVQITAAGMQITK